MTLLLFWICQEKESPQVWTRLPPDRRPKFWEAFQGPVVPLKRNPHGHPLAGHLWERKLQEELPKQGWEQVHGGNASSFTQK